jgi:phage I-like protein
MDPKEIATLTATNETLTKTVAEQKTFAAEVLSATGKATPSEAIGAILGLKASAERLPVVEAELQTIRAAALEAEVLSLVDEAVKAGRLIPAKREEAVALGKKDVATLKAFLSMLPQVVPAAPAATPKDPDAGVVVALTENELKYAKQFGLDPKAVLANKQRLLAAPVRAPKADDKE